MYMNIQLSAAEEYIKDKHQCTVGDILIRCNNVLYIREISWAIWTHDSLDKSKSNHEAA